MAERTISVPTYTIVCVALVALTVLTVGISFIHLRSFWHLVIGLVIALLKGSLVVLFFMHAIHATKQTWLVVVVTGFWLVAILFGMTLTDYFSRGMVPYTPGH
jgi:cytochrome c oxidase subunit IV